jgi:OOP family OmpA-OmpF porin
VVLPENFTDNMIDGINVRLENIYFDFDQAFIRPDAIEILNRHADLFNRYPKWKILISGHTDNMGSETYNVFLSKKRAKTVADYLVARGVKRSRIKYEGKGFSKPSVANTTEEGRQLNRRCEFQFIR